MCRTFVFFIGVESEMNSYDRALKNEFSRMVNSIPSKKKLVKHSMDTMNVTVIT